jgi:hypothetical protein
VLKILRPAIAGALPGGFKPRIIRPLGDMIVAMTKGKHRAKKEDFSTQRHEDHKDQS